MVQYVMYDVDMYTCLYYPAEKCGIHTFSKNYRSIFLRNIDVLEYKASLPLRIIVFTRGGLSYKRHFYGTV